MWQFETSITEIIKRAPGIKSFRFAVPLSGVKYRSGQYFYVTLNVGKTRQVHHFSFSSSPTEKGYIEFTKRITQSDYSAALDRAVPGTPALVEGPEGHFTLPRICDKLVFISGGIGITPLRSMLLYVKHKQFPCNIILLYGNRSYADIPFKQELDSLAGNGIAMEYFLDDVSDGTASNIHPGLINENAIKQFAPDFMERKFYISGPPSMVENISRQISKLGIRPSNIKFDVFTGYQ